MIHTKIKILVVLVGALLLTPIHLFSQNEFITIWKTDNPGSFSNTQIIIPTIGSSYNYSVNWVEVDI